MYFQVNMDGERNDGTAGQYDQICNARLPRGLDPHSVPSEELGASLGYGLHFQVSTLKIYVHGFLYLWQHYCHIFLFQFSMPNSYQCLD